MGLGFARKGKRKRKIPPQTNINSNDSIITQNKGVGSKNQPLMPSNHARSNPPTTCLPNPYKKFACAAIAVFHQEQNIMCCPVIYPPCPCCMSFSIRRFQSKIVEIVSPTQTKPLQKFLRPTKNFPLPLHAIASYSPSFLTQRPHRHRVEATSSRFPSADSSLSWPHSLLRAATSAHRLDCRSHPLLVGPSDTHRSSAAAGSCPYPRWQRRSDGRREWEGRRTFASAASADRSAGVRAGRFQRWRRLGGRLGGPQK